MKIMSFSLVPLLAACIFATACSPKAPAGIGQATVTKEFAALRVRASGTSKTLKILEPGDKVELLELQGSWYRVRFKDAEGWMSVSNLMTDEMRNHIQEGVNSAISQIPQNTGSLTG